MTRSWVIAYIGSAILVSPILPSMMLQTAFCADDGDHPAPAKAAVPRWFVELPPNKWTPTAMGPVGTAPWQQGTMIVDVPRPCSYGTQSNFQDLSRAWNGACVNPDDNELLLVLNGGHAARQSNDAWALSLGTDQPSWTLIAHPTPVYRNDTDNTRTPYTDAYTSPPEGAAGPPAPKPDGFDDRIYDRDGNQFGFSSGSVKYGGRRVPGYLNDGVGGPSGPHPDFLYSDANPDPTKLAATGRRPKTAHTCSHYHYAHGKVWFAFHNSWNSGSGPSSAAKLYLDRAGLKNGTIKKEWEQGKLGPWGYAGPIHEIPISASVSSAFAFGTAAMDRGTGLIWYIGASTRSFWAVNTTDGSHTYFRDAKPGVTKNASSISAIGLVPAAGGGARTLWVHLLGAHGGSGNWIGTNDVLVADITGAKPAAPPSWSQKATNGGDFEWAYHLSKNDPTWPKSAGGHGQPGAAWGLVWHEPSLAFLAYNPDQIQKQGLTTQDAQSRSVIRKLAVPMTGGVYDPDGPWTWSEIDLGPEAPGTVSPGASNLGGGGGSYTRFNILPNFDGAGNALLMHFSAYDKPVMVAKIKGVLGAAK